jgi:GT2 family glycosyltransferase
MKKITIVTVNFNTTEDTNNFLDSLKQLKTPGYALDTIVVDNGSTEKFLLKKTQQVFLIRSEINTGFTGGYNLGIQEALDKGADYVLIVNNDTILDPDMVTNLANVLESDPETGVAIPKIYFAKGHEFHKKKYTKDQLGKVFWYAGGYFDWANVKSVHRGVDEVDHGQYNILEETTFATGCCLLVKKEVFKKVGLFDERYFLYYEDADFSMRVSKAEYSIMYVPQAFLYHKNASSSGGAGNDLQDYFITRNQMLFGMTYAPVRSRVALVKQSLRLLKNGRPNQKKAIKDFYGVKFGKGTFF